MPDLPQTSDHLSDVSTDELIDQYGGEVESQFAAASVMRQYARIRPIRGTDTIVNNRVGRTQLQKLVAGVRPDATPTNFGKVSLTVDTVVLARDNRSMLNEFQTHFNARMELAEDHGKEIGKFFDQAFIIQTIKGAGMAAPANLNGSIGAGHTKTLTAAGDESDPDKLYRAIADIIVEFEEQEIPTNELIIWVRPTAYDILTNNNKLVDKDFSPSNGDFAASKIKTLKDVRVEKSVRIPITEIPNHYLSNTQNGFAYDIAGAEARCVAVISHPRSLLAGETIPLTSDIWFNKEEKQWFIDSYLSFGVTVNRPDLCGRVLKAA
jgi:hypothetical protein